MNESLMKLRQVPLLQRSIVRFAGVGVLSTTADIVALHLLYPAFLNVYVATAIGFFIGLTIGFILNGRFVFKTDRSVGRYTKYALVSLAGLGWTELIIHYVYKDWDLTSAMGAKLVAVGIVFFWNYGLSKVWAFK